MGSSSNGMAQGAEPAWRGTMRNGMTQPGFASPPPGQPPVAPPGQPPGPPQGGQGGGQQNPAIAAWLAQMQALRGQRPAMPPEMQAWQAQRPEGQFNQELSDWRETRPQYTPNPQMEAWRSQMQALRQTRPGGFQGYGGQGGPQQGIGQPGFGSYGQQPPHSMPRDPGFGSNPRPPGFGPRRNGQGQG